MWREGRISPLPLSVFPRNISQLMDICPNCLGLMASMIVIIPLDFQRWVTSLSLNPSLHWHRRVIPSVYWHFNAEETQSSLQGCPTWSPHAQSSDDGCITTGMRGRVRGAFGEWHLSPYQRYWPSGTSFCSLLTLATANHVTCASRFLLHSLNLPLTTPRLGDVITTPSFLKSLP